LKDKDITAHCAKFAENDAVSIPTEPIWRQLRIMERIIEQETDPRYKGISL